MMQEKEETHRKKLSSSVFKALKGEKAFMDE